MSKEYGFAGGIFFNPTFCILRIFNPVLEFNILQLNLYFVAHYTALQMPRIQKLGLQIPTAGAKLISLN